MSLNASAPATAVVVPEETSAGLWVGLIEWGSEYDDRNPAIFVAHTELTVVRAVVNAIVNFWADVVPGAGDGEPEWILDNPAPLAANDLDTLKSWLGEYRDESTAAWATIEHHTVLD